MGGRGDARARHDLLLKRAKAMRAAPTPAEEKLWSILRGHRLGGHKWKQQVPIDPYIADFACLRERLLVEADGGHHGDHKDAKRNAYLRSRGFRVLRFTNADVLDGPDWVAQQIKAALDAPLPPTR